MSASNQKKIRKQEREVYRSERERQEALEAQKLKKQTIAFVLVIALCLSVFLGSFLVSPIKNVIYRNTIAVTVGDHDLTSVDVNYFYIDAINNYLNQYYYYIYLGYIKLDMSKPLDKQVVDDKTGETWAESFLEMAVENIKSTMGLYDLAMKNNHKLTEDEQKELDSLESNLKDSAKKNSFNNVKAMLQSTYGNGATLDSYMAYYEICTYANSFYTWYQDQLKEGYTSEDLREFEGKETYKYNSYTYSSFLVEVEDFLPKIGKDEKHTDAQIKAAEEAARKVADALAAGKFETVEDFDKAIDAAIKEALGENKTEDKDETNTNAPTTKDGEVTGENTNEGTTEGDNNEGTTEGDNNEGTTEGDKEEDKDEEKLKYISTLTDDVLYSSVSSLFKDWVIGKLVADEEDKDEEAEDDEAQFEERKVGDMKVFESSTTSGDKKTVKGFYVVRFGGCNDNTYALADVRHVLVKFEGGKTNSTTGKVTYTKAEKEKAKAEAEKLYNDWVAAGKLSEDDFAELAKKNSDDGNASQGGLYEGIYPGQMVAPFEDWCFDEARKPGDHGLVETEYGWHLMFYVGDNETTYRDYMVTNDKLKADMEEWFDGIVKNSQYEEKNMKHVKTDLILGM